MLRVMYVKNVIVHLFTYFCHRNIYCPNASKWYFKTIWKCWGGWGFLWGEVFRYFKIPFLYAAEWIFCSSIYYSSNDLKNETVSCTERSLENWSLAILIAGTKMMFHQFTGRKFSPFCLFPCICTDQRRQQSCLLLWSLKYVATTDSA